MACPYSAQHNGSFYMPCSSETVQKMVSLMQYSCISTSLRWNLKPESFERKVDVDQEQE